MKAGSLRITNKLIAPTVHLQECLEDEGVTHKELASGSSPSSSPNVDVFYSS